MISQSSRCHRFFAFFILFVFGAALLQAQTPSKDPSAPKKTDPPSVQTSTQNDQDKDPLKRPLTPKQTEKSKGEKLEGIYKRWLDMDVRYIITDEELSAFKKLATNAERDQFMEAFWQRSDPTPDNEEN